MTIAAARSLAVALSFVVVASVTGGARGADEGAGIVVAGDEDKAADDLTKKILDDAKKAIDEALSEAVGKKTPAAKSEPNTKEAGPAADVAALAGNTAPIPVPADASAVDYDGANDRLEFTSAAAVKDIAAFYRKAMKADGWKEERSVINKDTMAVLSFEKGEKDLSLTIMRLGEGTNVLANGTALHSAEAAATEEAKEDAAANTLTADQLVAEDKGGLPVPTEHSSAGYESTPFRMTANAGVPGSIEAVLGFYRRELIDKKGWKEEAGKTKSDVKAAEMSFETPEGPAKLVLKRKKGETEVALTLRKAEEAKKSGFLPGAGLARLMFGNILDKDASITIDKKTVKIGAHVGEKAPDGPNIEVKPGKYTYTLKAHGQPAKTEEVEVGADEIWAFMAGPGGALVLQMY